MSDVIKDLSELRLSYQKGELHEQHVNADPHEQFLGWFNTALEAKLHEPYAMSLATANAQGRPHVRTVLLRGATEAGYDFYTNYDSQKGLDLAANPYAELLFYWPELERQIRVAGKVLKISVEESTDYYHKRPRDSQIAAHISTPQSGVIESRMLLQQRFQALHDRVEQQATLTKPEFWGGYRLKADYYEFWQGRPNRLHDRLVYENKAYPKRFYTAQVSEDERVLFIYESGEGRGNALFMQDLTQNSAPVVQLASDFDYQYTPIEVIGNRIYFFTNYQAAKNKIMAAELQSPELANWKEVVPEKEQVLSDVRVIGGKLFLTYDKDASNHAYVYDLQGKELQEIELPSLGSVSFNGDKDDEECFFSFTSFTIPGATYKYDVQKNSYELFRAPKVKFHSDDFVTEQVFFTTKDGAKIPMFLTYQKGLKKNGKNPVFLYGYGGFNISLYPSFSINRIPFLENGGIYVQVNLRGGSEYGEDWHVAGTKMQKQNVFNDFIAAAEYLIDNKYTNPQKIAIVGGSNGGLLVGACMTQRPDLFRVAIPQVGVMDMLRYHKFTIGWNWASDYGTSEDSKEMFEYLKGYSPLHNLKKGTKYPATLVTTADHDDRVVPAHSFKFAATLQACNEGSNPTLIRIDSKAGHGAGKPMSKILEEQADVYGFIMYNLNMKPKF